MRTNLRVRHLALTALCAGGTMGVAGLVAGPGSALAATTTACSNVYASGSTLQTHVQQDTLTQIAAAGKAFTKCSPVPSVFYNTLGPAGANANQGGTGSGAGLTEFGLQAGTSGFAVTPSKSQNGSFLDGFIGTDDPPSAAAMTSSATAAGSDPEPVAILQAPVAIVVNLPAGCTVKKAPDFTNVDLSKAFDDNISWSALLTDAAAKPTAGCSTTAGPTIEVRSDGSGTSFATKQYLSQIDSATWSAHVNDNVDWPAAVSTTHGGVANQGSGGEAAAVAATDGTIGYVNSADASAAGFGNWAAGSDTFWVNVQDNGTATTKVIGAGPLKGTGKKANCPTVYTGTVPAIATRPDWTRTFVAAPKQAAGIYALCTLTYDVAWHTYAGAPTLAADYTGNYPGETVAGVATTTKDYLTWLLGNAAGQGQVSMPNFYGKLPSKVRTAAAGIVKSDVAIN